MPKSPPKTNPPGYALRNKLKTELQDKLPVKPKVQAEKKKAAKEDKDDKADAEEEEELPKKKPLAKLTPLNFQEPKSQEAKEEPKEEPQNAAKGGGKKDIQPPELKPDDIPIVLPKYIEPPRPKDWDPADELVHKKKKNKYKSPDDICYDVNGEPFTVTDENMFDYNWWEICFFPYIICNRCWNFIMSLCGGSQQCLIFWMIIQWLVCKITKATTPDPIIYPYFFYVFFQAFGLGLLAYYGWKLIGHSVIVPYILGHYFAASGAKYNSSTQYRIDQHTRRLFRKYCFRKAELFDTIEDISSFAKSPPGSSFTAVFAATVVDVLLYEMLGP